MIVVCFFFNNRNKFLCLLFKKQKNKNTSIHLITRTTLAEHVKAAGDTRDTFRHCQESCFTTRTFPGRRQIKHQRCLLRSAQGGVAVAQRSQSWRRETPRLAATLTNCKRGWALTWAVGIAKLAMAPSEMEMSGLGWPPHAGITRRRQQTEG